ncbi:MAG: hypothetical protein H8D42_03010 [Candidatus Marinimicrobia bacterium]|nr:hypothetical protein [Candidatus Neomarinimicrobiota bacterium]MBL7066267.1 hypothetical protein [Candidatus Neomarinimicrobiota bacterium]
MKYGLRLPQYSLLMSVFGVILFFSCSEKEDQIPDEKILARIGNKTIAVNEFIRRAEHTIRPAYCKQDNYIHKKIILNSLIAEKLFALEAGLDNELVKNEEFRNYIRGRQEQAMRQYFYYDRAYNKVEPDTAEIKRVYKLAGRIYRIQYLRLPDENSVSAFMKLHREGGIPFDSLAMDILGDSTIPERQINFNDDLSNEFFDLFYSKPLEKDQLIGPVKNEDDSFLIMKVAGWKTRVVISDKEIKQRWNDVRDKLKNIAANQLYNQQVSELMKGKRLKFTEDTFYQLTDILAPLYMKNIQDKKEAFNQKFWKKEVEVDFDTTYDQSIESLRHKPLFTLDGIVWTVADFEKALQSHPLVFRKRQFSSKEFPEQFKYAVADLVRDIQINREAYKVGYNNVPVVKNYANMWHDDLVSMHWRNEYLKRAGFQGNFGDNYMEAIEDYLNPYVDSLQQKYSDLIEINTDAFEKIDLTNIDMFAIQRNVPYPIVSPSFPILTTDNKLDYGRKMIIE